jgi:tetratricopeptide (TPR) repeat protein
VARWSRRCVEGGAARLAAIALLLASVCPCQETRPETRPDRVVEAARSFIAAGEGARAVEILLPALEKQPDDLEINLALAEAHLAAEDLRAARRHADRAQHVAPKDPRAALAVGHVLFRMGEHGAERSGSRGVLVRATFADAASAYEEALALGADAYQAAFWAAEAHERAEGRAKALAAIERALSARPTDPAALAVKGRLLLEAGSAAEALPVFAEVLRAAPSSAPAAAAAVGSIEAMLRLGDVKGVAAAFPKLTNGDPHGANLRIYEVVAAAFRGSPHEDLWDSLLESADRSEPRLPLTSYYRAELAIRRSRDKDALAFADRYLAAAPDDPGGHLLRAVALRKLGRLAEARTALGKAYDLDHERAGTRDEFRYLVAAFFAAKQYKDAADVQEFVVHLTGAPADRYDYAVLRLDAGSPAEAERIYRDIAADREAPASERARALNALALLLQSESKADEAEAAFRSALGEDPDHLDARENLGILLVARGRADEGKKELLACVAKDPARKRSLYHLLRIANPGIP